MTTTTRRPATLDERQAAAELRAKGAAEHGYETQRQRRAAGPGTAAMPPWGPRREDVTFPAQLRAKKVTYNDMQLVQLHGVASVYDIRYEMWDMFGPYDEIVDGHAGDETLAAGPDVTFLENHKGLSMARTVAMPGKLATLIVANEDVPEYATTGLGSNAYVNPKRSDVNDLVIAIEDGQVTEMSFAFMIDEGWWSDDWTTYKITKFDINRGDVSAVNYGANPYTSIALRQQTILHDAANMPPSLARAVLRQLMGRADVDIDALYRAYAAGQAADVSSAQTRAAEIPEQRRTRTVALVRARLAADGDDD